MCGLCLGVPAIQGTCGRVAYGLTGSPDTIKPVISGKYRVDGQINKTPELPVFAALTLLKGDYWPRSDGATSGLIPTRVLKPWAVPSAHIPSKRHAGMCNEGSKDEGTWQCGDGGVCCVPRAGTDLVAARHYFLATRSSNDSSPPPISFTGPSGLRAIESC